MNCNFFSTLINKTVPSVSKNNNFIYTYFKILRLLLHMDDISLTEVQLSCNSPTIPDAGLWNMSTFELYPASQALIEHSRECQAGSFLGDTRRFMVKFGSRTPSSPAGSSLNRTAWQPGHSPLFWLLLHLLLTVISSNTVFAGTLFLHAHVSKNWDSYSL